MRAARAASAAARLLCGFTLLISVATNAQVPEPEGYRMDDYRTPTPQTVAGGTVLDTTAAYKPNFGSCLQARRQFACQFATIAGGVNLAGGVLAGLVAGRADIFAAPR